MVLIHVAACAVSPAMIPQAREQMKAGVIICLQWMLSAGRQIRRRPCTVRARKPFLPSMMAAKGWAQGENLPYPKLPG